MKILRPSFFASVPRLFNRIYSKIAAETIHAPGIRGFIFRRAFLSKKNHYQATGSLSHSFWDVLIFSRIASIFGGRLRNIVCGSAPINPAILQYFRIVLSTDVFEGYGLTESSACGAITLKDDPLCGSVGVQTTGGKIRLVDVPELNYFITDKPQPRGEVLLSGPFVFEGYYRDAKMTESALTPHGWLITGDIGTVDKDGRLYIIDRKKNVFKLSQGEYIAPEKLEKSYSESPYVSQIFIDGNPLYSFIVSIVVPDFEKLNSTYSDNPQQLKSYLMGQLNSLAKSQGLQK